MLKSDMSWIGLFHFLEFHGSVLKCMNRAWPYQAPIKRIRFGGSLMAVAFWWLFLLDKLVFTLKTVDTHGSGIFVFLFSCSKQKKTENRTRGGYSKERSVNEFV